MANAWASLPAAWSNKKKVERLDPRAYASLTRMLARAVADTDTNFSIWSALRTKADQIALFKANYTPTRRGRKYSTDRAYAGRIWARKPGGVSVASPDLGSNHQDGMAVDIHPGKIQNWIRNNGLLYGWSWDEGKRVGEAWHFRYVPGRDQMRSEGKLDHAWVQRIVGASVDGKIGTGTVAKIKKWQKAHGLVADGKVGPKTKAAMLGKIVADDAVEDASSAGVMVAIAPVIDGSKKSPNHNEGRFGHDVKHITVHWWGKPTGQSFDGIRNWLCDPAANVSATYMVSNGRCAQLVSESDTSWANGDRTANREGITIECDPNDVTGTLPYLAGLIADIRSRHGDLPIYPHQHWVSTECPGEYLPLLGDVDKLARGMTVDAPTQAPVTSSPKAPSKGLPTGKALLMALVNAPDFPLLRTSTHKCYFGPKSGPKESVSGHQANRLNPGAVGKSGAGDLKTWQKRMNKRGYSLAVDGLYGPNTEKAAKNLQKLAGITVDGLIGPDCWYAAWLLPIQ